MIKNFIITTLRVLFRNKGFTAINILGLSIGFASCIFIALYINHEVSFDRFHKNSDRIHRLTFSFSLHNEVKERMGITAPRTGEDLLNGIPEVEKILRLGFTGGDFKYGDRQITIENLFHADTTLWDFLDFKLLMGSAHTALKEPFTIVLSETTAKSIFGNENPIGKVILKDGSKPYTVTGVVQDCPTNTRIKYNGFVSFSTLYNITTGTMTEWDGNLSFYTLLMLTPGANPNEVVVKGNAIADDVVNPKMAEIGARFDIGLQPIRDIHLYNDLNYDKPGVAKILYIVSAIALLILFIAGFNFVNLTTARSTRRAKEVGLRMTVGASKGVVRGQFIGESLILAIISTLISLIIVELLMPSYNNLLGLDLSLYNSHGARVGFSLPFFTILFGLIAGLYPAFFLSSFKPIRVLKADFGGVKSKPIIRNILVTIQFIISSMLIITTAVVYLQINFLKSKPLGLNTKNLIVARANGDNIWQRVDALKNTLNSIPEVKGASISTSSLGSGISQNGYRVEGLKDPLMISALGIDYDFLEVIGARLVDGRNLSEQFPSDERGVIVNETLVKLAGWDDPIGKKIVREKEFIVVGVVEDFHYKSLHSGIEPIIMFLPFHYFLWGAPVVNIRLNENMTKVGLEKIREAWETLNLDTDFNYSFTQDVFNSQYRSEESFGKLFIYFSLLAVVISCLGLLGLSSFMLENRKREIGIRKVMGSSISSIISKFSIDFTKWALLGTIISYPIVFYAITQLLNFYPYRIEMPWHVYPITAILTFTLSLATILFQTYVAAKTNPVETLKYE